MRRYEGKLAGILGAIIIHLTAGIIFMLVKIGSLNFRIYTREYQIALEEITPPEIKSTKIELTSTSYNQILMEDREILDIARNIANKPDVKINAADYIDKVKEELIRSGKIGKDNFIDEQKKLNEASPQGTVVPEDKSTIEKEQEKIKLSQQMAANYSGPTRIYYNLPGRTHSYLPIPIYKCEGSGKAVLSIEVNAQGVVISARINEAESTISDQCLVETAIDAALISRFNPDIRAQKVEVGTITYLFVAQK
jgi:hypothetical protein